MADPSQGGIQAPYLDPSAYPDYLDVQRKQMMAQLLMQNMQQSSQTPEDWDRMKVVPHRGLLQNLAPIASALLAGKAMKGSQQAEQKYFQNMYGGGQPQQAQQPAPQDQQAAAQPGSQPPSSGLLPQQPQQQNPMLPPGASRGTAQMALGMMGPQEYAKGVMLPQLMGSPEWQTALRANNGNVQATQQQLLAEARVKGTTHMRQGEDIMLPNGQTIRNPALGPGETLTRDAQGNPQSVSLIPGAAEAAGTLKGTTTAAEEQNKPRMIPMGGGVERLGYPQDVGAGLPPALRPQPGQPPQAPAAPQQPPQAPRSYFPRTGQAPQGAGPQLPRKDPATGSFDNNLWSGIPKMQVPSTPGQTSNAYQQEIVKSAAAKHQELVNEYGKQSAAGVQQLEYLTEAEKALPKAETGPMSEYLTHNRGLLIQSFPSLAGALGGDKVTPTLELNKQLTNAALQGARSTFGSRMTQNEVKLQTEEMSPSVAMTHDALVSLIHQAKMKAAYAIQQDKDYGEYHAANGDPNRFESQYNVRRPITRFAAQYETHPQALERLKQNPHLLPDFKAKFGWDPTQ